VISPDGAWIARWAQTLDASTGDVEIWKLDAVPQRVRALSGSAGTLRAAFSPDGRRLVTADAQGRLIHWDVSTGGRNLWRDRNEWRPYQLGAGADGVVDSLDAHDHSYFEEDRALASRGALADLVTALVFSPDGRQVLVAYQRGNLDLFDAASGKLAASFRGHRAWTDEDLWEATLITQRLGLTMDPIWPRIREFLDPLSHLAALDAPLPEGLIRAASRARLLLLRNAVYARRGAVLQRVLLRNLFSGSRWYKPSPEFTPEHLTPVDRDNILRIKRREQALGGPLGDKALLNAFAIKDG